MDGAALRGKDEHGLIVSTHTRPSQTIVPTSDSKIKAPHAAANCSSEKFFSALAIFVSQDMKRIMNML